LSDAVFAYASNIDQLEILGPAVQRIAYKHASLGVKPEQYPIVGKHLLAAIQSVLDLPDDHPALTAWGEAYGVLAQIFIDTEAGIYASSESEQGGWEGFRPFKISKIIEETPDVKSFYFFPSDGKGIQRYSGGQYLGIKLPGSGGRYDEIRQYSLSSWGDTAHYRISVKSEEHGTASGQLHEKSVGDEILLTPPGGLFTLKQGAEKHVFIAGGVGITPLYSMLQEALASGVNTDHIQFIQCCKSADHQIFKDDLVSMCSTAGINFKTAFEIGDGADQVGYLSEAILEEWIIDKTAQIYFCGPKPFMSAVKAMLNGIGFPDNQLHYEVFGPTTEI
jgi:nitric oxide dioxygenase